MFTITTILSLLFLPLLTIADPTPTSPDSTTVVMEGQNITALWTSDMTGEWTNMTITLMTGWNIGMIPLLDLGKNIDATTTTSFSALAPQVSPHSGIYFLQFTNAANVTAATFWTTRFTIVGADGQSTPPTNSTDFNGGTVEWGTGVLVDATNTTNDNTTVPSTTPSAVPSSSPSPSPFGGLTAYNTDLPISSATGSTTDSPPVPSASSAALAGVRVEAGGVVGMLALALALVV
ncbi:hypothetical protein TREMEDRAFT_71572 [Tremella mesenterica DSM 1558]|uniref:uncharacterized protein n=1 Tax=Tremella mesenterica (strain ATCC 24925 / CBS 8224 / DSM 1558 / NBRC 9311 / NRRL Y-6157 / RJB 2259-6 / UBC 559-6) TaxID=578456 RepID=UPI0003F49C3A|nr:uncharacterized protein TREMEDRAFT_71572 [Tremella mesenterica DSM 1558]EIW70275.1 hypothetical protein TREMEDRAFT_71572 [Tremella mesenterica DSM 1558]